LYKFLKDKLKKRQRKVSHLQEYFSSNGLHFRYCPHGDSLDRKFTNKHRDTYFRSIPNKDLKEAVILLDPDNGLEVKSAGPKTLHKYVTLEEVEGLYQRMNETSLLVLYQHLPRKHRKAFLYSTAATLQNILKCPLPYSVSDGLIAFILIAKTKKRQNGVRDTLSDYLRLNLTLYD